MAIARVNLADLQQTIALVDANGLPSPAFVRYLNTVISSLKNTVNSLVDVNNAVIAANAAAAAATTAAASANTAAATANTAVATTNAEAALRDSWIVPSSVLTATPTIITIAGHTRYYADGTSVAVTGGTKPTTAIGDVDYVSYSDPSRAGGAVTFVVSTTQPTQTGNVHVVGAITIPAAGSSPGGGGPTRPGNVNP